MAETRAGDCVLDPKTSLYLPAAVAFAAMAINMPIWWSLRKTRSNADAS